jgi:hypothetical protein
MLHPSKLVTLRAAFRQFRRVSTCCDVMGSPGRAIIQAITTQTIGAPSGYV